MDSVGVTYEVEGVVGYLTLNQPKTLNALTLSMVESLTKGLNSHILNDDVLVIILRSTHQKAFCAGGDMKRLWHLSREGNFDTINGFFETEYALNLAIANCPKPYISLIDGIAMGGGLGLSVHGRYRLVTEKAILAMPESKIGFFPDVGASYFLPRLPYRAGWWLGLTATPVKGKEAVLSGLATHYIHGDKLPTFIAELQRKLPELTAQKADTVDSQKKNLIDQIIQQCLNQFVPESADNQSFLNVLKRRASWFSDDDITQIREKLSKAASEYGDAEQLMNALEATSPYSHRITLELFANTSQADLESCLELELKYALESIKHPDFFEGIRAVLIDKDNAPTWAH